MSINTTPGGLSIFHADHGIEEAHGALIDAEFEGKEGFVLSVIEIPEGVPSLQSSLYGPSAGDGPVGEKDVHYYPRAGRSGPSRLIVAEPKEARKMVVVGVAPNGPIYTAYGTTAETATPREWWDPTLRPQGALESATFWGEHALCISQEDLESFQAAAKVVAEMAKQG
jgi:hypothetical protein